MDAWSDIADEYAARVEPFTDSFVAALLDEIAPSQTLDGVRVLEAAVADGVRLDGGRAPNADRLWRGEGVDAGARKDRRWQRGEREHELHIFAERILIR